MFWLVVTLQRIGNAKLTIIFSLRMSNETQFQENALPFDGLAKLGIDQDGFNHLPDNLKTSLLKGEVTPVIEAQVITSQGKEVKIPLRMQLLSDGVDNNPKLVVYPIRPNIDNTLGLSQYEMERIKAGEVIRMEVLSNGRRFPEFVQLDPRTNSLVHCRVSDLKMDSELASLESIKDIQLGTQQKDAIRDGRPVELQVGDEKVTVGVNLTEPQGFKVIKGDMDEWKRQEEMRYDIAHPEIMGFVKTDRNRWEYQQVVNAQGGGLNKKQEANESLSNKTGMKF